ncbi:MAG: MBL fold metallo-hydrolase [Candidatus Dojkabacteria bacterium]|nr:MBL fold metallo-hydrolase [Candidatus Dojkabacteria bacterium]
MKIKRVGWTSFLISSPNVSAITDPIMLSQSGVSFPKTKADIAIFSGYNKEIKDTVLKDNKLDNKVVVETRPSVMEIYTAGEFEIGGLMIRRDLGQNFYIIDEKNVRVVYLGGTDNDFQPDVVKDVGDVDVLIIPVGDGIHFMDFEKLEKVISNIDPAIILPCAYKEENSKMEGIKSKEEFIKYFGFANVSEETTLNVSKRRVEEEQQSAEVIFLK